MSNTVPNLIFIPHTAPGHITSTIEFAKLLVKRDENLSITVLTAFRLAIKKPLKRISFFNLYGDKRRLTPSESKSSTVSFKKLIDSHVEEIMSSGQAVGFVVDMFRISMIDVPNKLDIPTYVYFTSNAGFLGFTRTLYDDENRDILELMRLDTQVSIQGFVKPVPTKVFPTRRPAQSIEDAKAIIVNTCSELETHAIKSLSKDNTAFPPVYPVGPILNLEGDEEADDVISWLNEQQKSTVVFLCFGSNGYFDKDQVEEIANALEQSGYPFLWSLRQPPGQTPNAKSDYEYARLVLPKGFFERTAKIGKVIGWAPQVTILGHPAIRGFVTHCGWNSLLESLWFGVPSATWPINAEQQLNAFEMVVELELAVEIKLDYKNYMHDPSANNVHTDRVTADVIVNAITRLMEDEEVRKKVEEISKKIRAAVKEGGSSYESVGDLIQDFMPCCKKRSRQGLGVN